MSGKTRQPGGFDAKSAASKGPKDAHGKAEGYTDETASAEEPRDPKQQTTEKRKEPE